MTVADVKKILNIAAADTTFDSQIGEILNDVIDSLEYELNREFDLTEDEEPVKIVPSGLQRIVAFDILQLLRGGSISTDVSSVKLGDYSVSYASGGIVTGSLDAKTRNQIVNSFRIMGVW